MAMSQKFQIGEKVYYIRDNFPTQRTYLWGESGNPRIVTIRGYDDVADELRDGYYKLYEALGGYRESDFMSLNLKRPELPTVTGEQYENYVYCLAGSFALIKTGIPIKYYRKHSP